MKNIIPALLSIIIGFAISSFVLNTYLSDTLKNDKPKTATKKDKEKVTETQKGTPTKKKKPAVVNTTKAVTVNLDEIQESFNNWNTYTQQNIDLTSTFNPLDAKGAKMDKGIFLTLLRTGAYIPVKSEKGGKTQYQLSTIKEVSDEKIKETIINKATIAHKYFKMEGKKLPRYDFVDLKSKSHNKADTKGKIVVLKCWSISSKVSVEEFPQLNALVDKYKDDNIEFISLAVDEKEELIKFLKTKHLKYVTVPNQKKYISRKLKVKQYPAHLIVDSRGVIIKMVNNIGTLTSELKRILGK